MKRGHPIGGLHGGLPGQILLKLPLRAETLAALGLKDVANTLEKIGKLGSREPVPLETECQES